VSSHGTEGSECIQSPIGGIDVTADIDWKTLRDKATEAAGNAYAPYSRFPVGAAALVDDGRVVAGCNVENVSYGLGLCAECSVVSAVFSGGGKSISSSLRLWPGLLGLAVLLSLAELVMRKWKGVMARA